MLLSMHSDEAGVVAVIGLFLMVIAIVWIGTRYKYKSERLRTIQMAIQAGQLDENTRQALREILAPNVLQRSRDGLLVSSGRLLSRLLFVVGWLTMVIGGVLFAGMIVMGGSAQDIEGAGIATAVGFGLVTLPIAMRELDARRSPARP
jgi:hypothetical protein